MTESLESWEREFFTESDGQAFLFYAIFGEVREDQPLDRQKYRSNGVPVGFELSRYRKDRDAEVFDELLEGYLWEQLTASNPKLARAIKKAPSCLILSGGLHNPEILDYLRDCVGLVTFLLDNGAVAVFDPQMFHWWTPEQWRDRLFEPGDAVPTHHAMILCSEEEDSDDLIWVHTRGMRKFGRPDISVRRVGPEYIDEVFEMCNRIIEYQAFGGVIPEGQAIRMASLPAGGIVHHDGDLDDPDFNNVHVEIVWPESALSSTAS